MADTTGDDRERSAALPALTRAAIATATVGYAAFTLLVQAARFLSLTFSTMAWAATAIGVAVALFAMLRVWKKRAILTRIGVTHLLALVVLCIAAGAAALMVNAPEEDDSLYVPASVQSLAHPERPMGVDLDWIVPFSSGVRLYSELGQISNVVEFFWACLSRLSGIEYLTLYQVAGTFLFAAAFPLVYFFLLTRFSTSTSASLVGTLVVTIAAFLLFREHDIGFGMAMNKIWLGKAILMTIAIPVVAAFSFDFLQHPDLARWGLLSLSAIASTGFSSSSLFLIPVLLAALTPGAMFHALSTEERGSRRWLVALAVPAAGFYPAAVAALFYRFYKDQFASHESVTFTSSAELFNVGFEPFFGSVVSITSVAVLLSFGYLLYWRRRTHLPLLFWFLTAIVVFVNPWTAGFVARNITSATAYVRVFQIIPVYALPGVAMSDVAERFFAGSKRVVLTVAIVFGAFTYAFLLGGDTLRRRLDVPKLRVFGLPHVGPPFVRVDQDLLRDVRELEQILPEGNTLATVDYDLVIPMLTTRFPQYYLWPIDIITFYGDTQGFPQEARDRHRTAQYLIGLTQVPDDLERVLDTPVRNVILSKRFGNDLAAAKRTVAEKRFVLVKETSRYVAYTRGPAGER